MIYFDLDLIISILISMTNIEDYVNNFTDAYEKISKRLINPGDKIHPNFDDLNESDKLFLFAKKLIMENDNFLTSKRIADLEKEVEEKNKKLIQLQKKLKSKNTELLEANVTHQNKINFEKNKYEDIISTIKKENSILDEDCYAYELKFNIYKKKYEDLLEKNNLRILQLKERIRGKINDFT